jgi:TonB family protein
MRKRAILLGLIMALAAAAALAAEAPRLELKFRVYEGSRQGAVEPPRFVASSYLQAMVQATLRTESDVEKERAEILRVFNLQDVRLLTEADLIIGEGGQAPDRVRYPFRLNGGAFLVQIVWPDFRDPGRCFLAFNEISGDKPVNVLTSEFKLLSGHSAVFGFDSRQGKPYFCSLRFSGPAESAGVAPPPPPPPPPQSEELKQKLAELEKGAVRVTSNSLPPRLLKTVMAEPPAGTPAGREGSVYMNIRIDAQGGVVGAVVMVSSDKSLEEPALRAIRQWKYEPFVQDGKPRDAVFSVIYKFPAR